MGVATHVEKGRCLGGVYSPKKFRAKVVKLMDDLEAKGIEQVEIKLDEGNGVTYIVWSEPIRTRTEED